MMYNFMCDAFPSVNAAAAAMPPLMMYTILYKYIIFPLTLKLHANLNTLDRQRKRNGKYYQLRDQSLICIIFYERIF